jgi:hypothetical protein
MGLSKKNFLDSPSNPMPEHFIDRHIKGAILAG